MTNLTDADLAAARTFAHGPTDLYDVHQARPVMHGLRAVTIEGAKVFLDIDLGTYRVMALARDPTTGRRSVVYVGIDGADRDKAYVCSPMDFAVRFRCAKEPDPVEVQGGVREDLSPEKVVGRHVQGECQF